VTDLSRLQGRAESLAADSQAELWALVAEASSVLLQIAPTQRRLWLASVVQELFDEQEGLCALCGEPLIASDLQVDHKIPFAYGGGNERGNIQLAHGVCNRRKRTAVDPRDLLRYLEDRYMNR
jgi:5-methylcytosine-specific restriction endonuclease McrA